MSELISIPSRRGRARVSLLMLTGAVLLTALVATTGLLGTRSLDSASTARAAVEPKALESARDLSTAFKQASRDVKPTVVNIRSIQRSRMGRGGPEGGPESLEDLFGEEFFRRFFGEMLPQQPFEREGMGSGVIVSEDGYLLTNYHVVRGADEIEVRLADARTFLAEVVGTDDKTDLAVLKIDAEELPVANFGDSDELEVGDWVMAVGNPFGFDHTVTAGIVSAKGRSAVGIVDYEDFIQTDAAINPGNSGGPLLNLEGEIVGINTAIVSRAGAFNGIGLAIPINMARQIMDSILTQGRVIRGWMGVGIQDLNEDLAQSFGYDSSEGVLISQVSPDSPADDAGFREGDIVIAFGGEKMENAAELRNTVAATVPGTETDVRVFREGKEETLTMTIGERESDAVAAAPGVGADGIGLRVQNLTPAQARQLGYEEARGVLIRQVEPGSLAARSGLRPSEVIVAVGDTDVENVGEFNAAMRQADLEEGVRLKVLSPQGLQRFVLIKKRG